MTKHPLNSFHGQTFFFLLVCVHQQLPWAGKSWTVFFFILFLAPSSVLGGLMEDFDSLGGNDVLLKRARLLQPKKEIRVVQNRVVQRRLRSEISPHYSRVFGGDSYLETQFLGLDYRFHISPNWALGLSYSEFFNNLSSEGDFLIRQEGRVPDLDYPKRSFEALFNYAPFYGKINFFNQAIVQFDVYGLASYGSLVLNSGPTTTYSLGVGLGLWISQHLTGRLEIRNRYYEAQREDGGVDKVTTVLTGSVGYML